MGENPFTEPDDADRTVIRPMPGGNRANARPAVRAAVTTPGPAVPPPGPDLEAVSAGDGPLAIAAVPLLQLLARLRNAATPPNPGDMLERTRRELEAFERRARDQKVPAAQLQLAHYALCAALDDVVLNTPWGSRGRWRNEQLARTLHDDPDAGRGFFQQLRTLRDDMPAARPVLEIMFLCLSLGMMGPYRSTPDGPAQLERARHHVFELIEGATPKRRAGLAPPVTGIYVPPPPRGGVPLWVAGSVAVAIVAGVHVWSLMTLNAESDGVYQAALAATPSSMPELVRPAATPPPPPPPAPPPGPGERIRAALAVETDVRVLTTASSLTLRIPAQSLFPQPNATLADNGLLDRIAGALADLPGPVRVLAFTDNQPFHSVGFPSNFALSTARAKAVRAALAHSVPQPGRITAEGRADAEPVAPNTTAAGRDQNRRIEIQLARPP